MVDGSAAICSDSSAADSLLSTAGVLLGAINSVELLISGDCSADAVDVLASGEIRPRGESN